MPQIMLHVPPSEFRRLSGEAHGKTDVTVPNASHPLGITGARIVPHWDGSATLLLDVGPLMPPAEGLDGAGALELALGTDNR